MRSKDKREWVERVRVCVWEREREIERDCECVGTNTNWQTGWFWHRCWGTFTHARTRMYHHTRTRAHTRPHVRACTHAHTHIYASTHARKLPLPCKIAWWRMWTKLLVWFLVNLRERLMVELKGKKKEKPKNVRAAVMKHETKQTGQQSVPDKKTIGNWQVITCRQKHFLLTHFC